MERSFLLNFRGFAEIQNSGQEYGLLGKLPSAHGGMSVRDVLTVENMARGRVLQIMKILRLLTDEEQGHSLPKDKLGELLRLYRIAKYDNGTPLESPNTLTASIENMLMEVDPLEYSNENGRDNDRDYKIKYEGYKEDRLKAKVRKEKGKKAPDITDFSYVHLFTHEELDWLIQLVCFSDMLSNEEKQRLVDKLASTASLYYDTPFLEKAEDSGEQLRFCPQAIHGRFSGRRLQDKKRLAGNIKRIQRAINDMCQIRFRFNRYTHDHEMAPKSEYLHRLSPYHLAVITINITASG